MNKNQEKVKEFICPICGLKEMKTTGNIIEYWAGWYPAKCENHKNTLYIDVIPHWGLKLFLSIFIQGSIIFLIGFILGVMI